MVEFDIYMVLSTVLKFLPFKPIFFPVTGGKTETHLDERKERHLLAPSNDNNKEALIGFGYGAVCLAFHMHCLIYLLQQP